MPGLFYKTQDPREYAIRFGQNAISAAGNIRPSRKIERSRPGKTVGGALQNAFGGAVAGDILAEDIGKSAPEEIVPQVPTTQAITTGGDSAVAGGVAAAIPEGTKSGMTAEELAKVANVGKDVAPAALSAGEGAGAGEAAGSSASTGGSSYGPLGAVIGAIVGIASYYLSN